MRCVLRFRVPAGETGGTHWDRVGVGLPACGSPFLCTPSVVQVCVGVSLHAMRLLLLAVSVAASAPVLGEAFVAANGKISATVSPFSRQTALSTSQQHMTTMAAAIVGGGRIGCALYVSITWRA